MKEIKSRILKLKRLINEHNHNYYDLNKNIISDFEYDKLLEELIDLENKFSVQFYYFGMFSFIASVITSPFTKNPNNFLVKFLYTCLSILHLYHLFKSTFI